MQKIDILILLFSFGGRDPEAIIPLAWYLEKIFNYRIKFGSIFDCRYLIDKYNPKVLLVNNIGGSEFNVLAADYAYSKSVIVISLTSEGLFDESRMSGFVWGNNKKQNINWHKTYVWSERYLSMVKKYLPDLKDTFDVSGSTGMDRYKIYEFNSKETLLKKYNKEKFKKVITYAGFSFGLVFNDEFITEYKVPKDKVNILRKDMSLVKDILKQLIDNNEDILFILKKHPSEKNLHMEIDYDWKDQNVLIIEDQETLGNIINISDVYITYESTTALEAYCFSKPVISLLPTNTTKYRNKDLYLGNALAKDYHQAQELVNEFYTKGSIRSFVLKYLIRKKIIKETVYSIDGLNSWRTAVKLDQFIRDFNNGDIKKSFSFAGLIMHLVLKFNFLLKILPKYRKSEILRKYNTFNEFYNLKRWYDPQIKKFYELDRKG